ncbi:polynucleotide adenylyltransferase PcnB [Thalassotalea sp. HSM 43]|uniref:polynucleotide adenylyltransferase PcnB n=1 Tax=Thalassotalea sp. HSM 43 TaxID=2552945 RepID=UPI001081E116|nr:polynucleotide adenylyltransferase PcnB [Thalassotalea sp. HSM 43]QBY04736.1 polynucleotide adenylyltransferase PcnB [Thalassotalea sp. HSM 43]
MTKNADSKQTQNQQFPIVFGRDEHNVSRNELSENALKVLYRLNRGGYDAYLVGGGVRDILLGQHPKDFDIVTNATPEQIKKLFRNCRLIGRRFRLAHIVFGRDIIEVATFRGHHKEDHCDKQKLSKQSEQGMLLRDNIYGSIDEDAERRDFTINALYYSIKDFKVYDFANGVADIESRTIRLIGDPETRYREDPVRMLRAIRFATKLDMDIDPKTREPIKSLAPLMANIPPARMFEEYMKLFLGGKALENFDMLAEYELLQYFFPHISEDIKHNSDGNAVKFVRTVLRNTDARINQGKRVTPAFLLAAVIWHRIESQIQVFTAQHNMPYQDAFFSAMHEVMSEQQRCIAIPKRFQLPMKDIWFLQQKLEQREPKKVFKTIEHPRFRAGYDFLLIRSEIEQGDLVELANWWTHFQEATPDTQQQMLKSFRPTRQRRRRNPRKRKKAAE